MSYRNYGEIEAYMSEVLQYPLLNSKEETELGLKARDGDQNAVDLLIKSNLRLVVKIAHNFKGLGVSLSDLVAEGNIGLITAAKKFDPGKGAKFSSYSALWIKQSIRNAIAKLGRTIRIPIQSLSNISKIHVAKKKLSEEHNREPTTTELSNYLGISESAISRLEKVNISSASLNSHAVKNESHGELIEIVQDTRNKPVLDTLLLSEDLTFLNSEYQNLRKREKQVINWRFGLDGSLPKTLQEISDDMGISRERVRQIQKTGLMRLRKLINRKY